MSYVKPAKKHRRKRRRHLRGVGANDDEESSKATVPLGAAMAALFITALVFGRKMR